MNWADRHFVDGPFDVLNREPSNAAGYGQADREAAADPGPQVAESSPSHWPKAHEPALQAVSVIVPTHGRPDLLAHALASIGRQTLIPCEVLVVDDAGDAETRRVVDECSALSAAPLRFLRNERPGACNSRNFGAAQATGEVLAFMDDDDEWADSFLEHCLAALAASDADFALADIDRTFPDGSIKRLSTKSGLTPRTVLNQRVYMTGSSFIIRKSAFAAIGGFDPDVPVFNDWDLFLRLVRSGKSYDVVHEPLVHWIEHSGDRISAPTLRRAEGIDRFLGVYGPEMRFHVRAYFLRIAYGIRKAHEPSRGRRAALTGRMLAAAGLLGASYIVWHKVATRIPRLKKD